jgi:hypothetical protein
MHHQPGDAAAGHLLELGGKLLSLGAGDALGDP